MSKTAIERFRKSKARFKTSAEAKAYFQGRLKELAVRAGMRVPELLEWAEHTGYDSYVSRTARSLRMSIDAASEIKERTEVWELRVKYRVYFPGGAGAVITTLYKDPMDADAAGRLAVSEQDAEEYSVALKEVK